MTEDEAASHPLMTLEMQEREFAVRLLKWSGHMYWQQKMRDADGNLVWVYLDQEVVE